MKNTITLLETKAGHFYEIEDSELNESIFLPSSTNILSLFPNPGLDFWFQSTTPEAIKKAQDDGKNQGTKVHKCMELQIMGEKVNTSGITDSQIKKLGLSDKRLISMLKEPLTEREEKSLVGAENFWEEFKPITVGSEIMVFSIKNGFAGTLDWVGYLWDKKKKKYDLWILDWKISKSLNLSNHLQVVSYWKAFQETYKKRLPQARMGILQLGKNKCNFSFKEIKNRAEVWKMFLKTKDIYDFIYPKSGPKIIHRRESFELNKFTRKGRLIKL